MSSRQIRWAQELFRCHFRINYCQSKTNKAVDALFCFPPKSLNKEKKLQAKNTQILHSWQSFFTRASLSSLSLDSEPNLSPFYRVLICGTYVLLQLCQFGKTFPTELADKELYKAIIGGMRLKLAKLQELDKEAQKIRATKELAGG